MKFESKYVLLEEINDKCIFYFDEPIKIKTLNSISRSYIYSLINLLIKNGYLKCNFIGKDKTVILTEKSLEIVKLIKKIKKIES